MSCQSRRASRRSPVGESSSRILTSSFVSWRNRCRASWAGPPRLPPLMIMRGGSLGGFLPEGVHLQGAQYGAADVHIGGKRRPKFGNVDGAALVQALRNLVQIVADAAAFPEQLAQRFVIDRGTPLGAGA